MKRILIFQVWNSNVVMDTCLGKASVVAPLNPGAVVKELELYASTRGAPEEKTDKKPGIITVEITTCDDLMRF